MPQWRLMAGGIVMLLAEVVSQILESRPLKVTVDSLVTALGHHTGSAPATVPSLVGLGIALLVIVVGRVVCDYLAIVAFALVGSHTVAFLRSRAFYHVQDLSQQFHIRNRSVNTAQRLIADVDHMQEMVVVADLPMAANTLTLLVTVAVMVFLDSLLTMIVLLAVVVSLFASSDNPRRIPAASLHSRRSEGSLINTAQGVFGVVEVIQAYGLEPLLHERFTGANSVSLSEGMCSRRIAACLERSMDVIVGVATAVAMVNGSIRVLNGAMSPGDLVFFTTYLRTTMKSFRDMAKYTGRIVRTTASDEQAVDLMAVKPDTVSPADAIVLNRVHGMIHFDHVHAAYKGRLVLHGVGLAMVLGERVTPVGPSGSGRSTLVSLVVRVLDPTSGMVSLDGRSLNELDLRFLRPQASILHQEAVPLAGTIRENIRLGRPDTSGEEVGATVHVAHTHEFITQISGGYSMTVGERGGALSDGQRRRIAIVRALLHDSSIVILGGVTTGPGPTSTSAVLKAVGELAAGHTILTVTRDPQTAMCADRVVWIQDGYIHLEGSPQDLMESSIDFRRWMNSHPADSFVLVGSGS